MENLDDNSKKVLISILSVDKSIDQLFAAFFMEVELISKKDKESKISRNAQENSLMSVFKDIFIAEIKNNEITDDDLKKKVMFEKVERIELNKKQLYDEFCTTVLELGIINDKL